jgi:hypothetical protein
LAYAQEPAIIAFKTGHIRTWHFNETTGKTARGLLGGETLLAGTPSSASERSKKEKQKRAWQSKAAMAAVSPECHHGSVQR